MVARQAVRARLADLDQFFVYVLNLCTGIQEDRETDEIVGGARDMAHVCNGKRIAEAKISLSSNDGMMAGGREDVEGLNVTQVLQYIRVKYHVLGGSGVQNEFTASRGSNLLKKRIVLDGH